MEKKHTGGSWQRCLTEEDKTSDDFYRLIGILTSGGDTYSKKLGATIKIDSFDLLDPANQELLGQVVDNYIGQGCWEDCGTILELSKKYPSEFNYLTKYIKDYPPHRPSGRKGNFEKNGVSIQIKRGKLGSLLNYANEEGLKTEGEKGINFALRNSKKYPPYYYSNDLGYFLFDIGFTLGNKQNHDKIRSNLVKKGATSKNIEAFDMGVLDARKI